MTFTVTSEEGAARCGCLATPSANVSTPALLLYTHRGSALNLTTPDMLEKLRPELQAVQLDVLQFITDPKPEVLRGCPGGGRAYLALNQPGLAVVATARDPATYEYAGAMRAATDQWATVTVHTGAATVTPEQYVEAAAALAPDVWVALSDDVPCDSRSDRIAKAVDRTIAWLGACQAAAAKQPALARAPLFAAVQGGQYLNQRARCAEAVAAQPGVAGYVVAALGTGESPELRRQIFEAVLPRLPAAAPRLASSVGAPEEVLEAGIDLFDDAYLAGVTAAGYALSFPLSPEEDPAQQQRQQQWQQQQQQQQQQPQQEGAPAAGEAEDAAGDGWQEGGDDSKLNLWALAYRTDKRPLLPGCSCFTCTNHSRAYVHHLLQTHEMTAQVLLELHNSHHYLAFFAAIRQAIAAGSFAAYRDWFLARRQRWLVGEGGGQV